MAITHQEAKRPISHCRESGCQNLGTTAGYCRPHYIKNWQDIKQREQLVRYGRLKEYAQELAEKYPESVLQAVRHDLSSDDSFERAAEDLGLHEGTEEIAAIETFAIDVARLEETPLKELEKPEDTEEEAA